MAGAGELPIPKTYEEPECFNIGFNYKPIEHDQIKRGDAALCSWTSGSLWYYGLFTNVGRKHADGYWMGEFGGYTIIGNQNQRFSMKLNNPKLKLKLIDPSIVPDMIRFYDKNGLLKEEYKKSQVPMPHENKITAMLKKINPF